MTKDEAIALKLMAMLEGAPSVLEYAKEIEMELTPEEYLWLAVQEQKRGTN
jgi:hypothetical protein